MSSEGGHRQDYQRVLSVLLGLEPLTGMVSPRNFMTLIRAKALLFGSLDDDVRGFVLIALLRALAGKKTAGLFLRPHSCFVSSSVQSKLKFAIFNFFKKLRTVSVCTILPFEVEPHYRQVASHGVADPQLWDRSIMLFDPSAGFAKQLRQAAGRRRIMAFIGTANYFKGVTQIREMMTHPDWNNSVFVVFAGQIPNEVSDVVQEAAALGALVIPRFVSNAELDAVYNVADFVWSAYQPGYDQASGNFGRTVQAGKIPVVRAGTLISRLATLINYPVIAFDFNEIESAIARLQGPLPQSGGPPIAQMHKWKIEFLKTMTGSL